MYEVELGPGRQPGEADGSREIYWLIVVSVRCQSVSEYLGAVLLRERTSNLLEPVLVGVYAELGTRLLQHVAQRFVGDGFDCVSSRRGIDDDHMRRHIEICSRTLSPPAQGRARCVDAEAAAIRRARRAFMRL